MAIFLEANMSYWYYNDMNNITSFEAFIGFIVSLLIIFFIFLAMRWFNCWYWKINERTKLLEEQNALLKCILANLDKDKK